MEKKKPGRPTQDTTPKLIRMPNSLIEKLEKGAEKEGLKFPAYVISLLTKAIK